MPQCSCAPQMRFKKWSLPVHAAKPKSATLISASGSADEYSRFSGCAVMTQYNRIHSLDVLPFHSQVPQAVGCLSLFVATMGGAIGRVQPTQSHVV